MLFKYEAKYGSWFWDDPHNLIHFARLVEGALFVINAAVVAGIGYFLVDDDSSAIQLWAGGGAMAGAIASFQGGLAIIEQVVHMQMDALGYQQYEDQVW